MITEHYKPRAVSDLGNWEIGSMRFKVYGILAAGRDLTKSIIADARAFAQDDVPPLVAAEGDDNGLGFIVIHPGDLGVSILVHWWIQGSVLCQHIQRTLCGSDEPMDTRSRPVIACVWELGLIDAEQRAWRETMMTGRPDAQAYLDSRAALAHV